MVGWFVGSLSRWFTGSFLRLSVRWFIRSLVASLVAWLAGWWVGLYLAFPFTPSKGGHREPMLLAGAISGECGNERMNPGFGPERKPPVMFLGVMSDVSFPSLPGFVGSRKLAKSKIWCWDPLGVFRAETTGEFRLVPTGPRCQVAERTLFFWNTAPCRREIRD